MTEARLCTPMTTSKFTIKAKTHLYQSHLVPNLYTSTWDWQYHVKTDSILSAQGKAFRCQVQNLEPPGK